MQSLSHSLQQTISFSEAGRFAFKLEPEEYEGSAIRVVRLTKIATNKHNES